MHVAVILSHVDEGEGKMAFLTYACCHSGGGGILQLPFFLCTHGVDHVARNAAFSCGQ